MRAEYPASIRIVRVPCTGKVDIVFILKTLESGVDGIYIVGCEEGNCHFMVGNIRARKRIVKAKKILETIGLEPERIEMFNLSAGDGVKFVNIAKEMTERILKLGPSSIPRNAVIMEDIEEAI